jgi:two-component system sensor histidine kinase BaeS
VTRRRPPHWWPEGEAWPPRGAGYSEYRGYGRPGAYRHRWAPFGCLFVLLGLFAAGAIVVGLWSAAAVIGVVEAPPIVIAGGIVALIVIVMAASAAGRASRRISQPLDTLIEAAGRVENGDYSVRVPVSGTGDMRSLARAFNQMTSRMEAGDARRRAFLADVAHELRTPLTVLQGQLEAMADGVYPADRDRLLALLGQSRSMARLVEDLRTISLAEVGALELHPSDTEIRPLLDEVVMAHDQAARANGVRLFVEPSSRPSSVYIDTSATRRILANVVSNALRHTRPGGSISIAARDPDGDGRMSVVVRDTGMGIPAELVPRVFERFAKGQTSDGSGLGLAIARDLAEAMGGSIDLTSVEGAGTTVTIRLPRASSIDARDR